jgi:HEPN domain-containing protein
MTPNAHEEAQRWLAEAEEDVAVAIVLSGTRHFSHACFHSQQAGEKSLKAFLCLCNVEEPWGHSVSKLVEDASTYDPALREIFQAGTMLDRYYIPTRYPNGLPAGSIPSKSYHDTDAQEAIRLAQFIIQKIKQCAQPKQ